MPSFDVVEILRNIVIFMPAFLVALVVHEFGHAWMAKRFGDKTSEWEGRLTLNPAAHIDPLGTIAFPLLSIAMGSSIFFGWAKPVPINPQLFTSYRKGLFWVSFAGPLSNMLLGLVAAFLYVAVVKHVPESFAYFNGLEAMLKALLLLNFSLAVFNLIPIPPLDGSNILLSFLSYNASRKFLEFQQYSFFLLLFLMFSGALAVIRYPILFLAQSCLIMADSVL